MRIRNRHHHVTGKSERNRSNYVQGILHIREGEKSASKLKCPRKRFGARRPKNSIILSHPERTNKLSRNGDNDSEMGDIHAPQGTDDTDYVMRIEHECILNFSFYSKLSLDNVAGLEEVKQVIKECWILPAKRPDLFKGLRYPVTGVLLFGASGTGKTTLGKCIASEMRYTFFNVSPSTLASKWMGETEKLIRALFSVAKFRQPSIIFIDNIDCILSPGNPEENGTMRGILNEFLLQMDSCNEKEDVRIVILGTTKRPQDLNEAARRRFGVRLHVPLPDEKGRKELLTKLLEKEQHCLDESELSELARKTNGYSGADLRLLCQDAAMGPIRAIPEKELLKIQACKVRPIIKDDFHHSLSCIKASISRKEVKTFAEWNRQFGHKHSIKRKYSVC